MSTPKGMTCRNFTLACRDQILLYHNAEHIIMQLRHHVPTEDNILNPSFKVAVELSPVEALALASELLTITASRIQAISTKTDAAELDTGDRVDASEVL
ncbi:MAG TPA: hypothetical protein VF026_23815 [Ktedonobacteraceae bacterium]